MSKDVPADIGFTFEAVLEAVQDSGRGRWFLDEYRKRMGHEDTTRLAEAIRRIETRIDGMAGHFTAAEDLAKVRQAINATRNDIAKLQPATEGLSAEGRMFAQLAELARKAMPSAANAASGLPQGIEQTLRLVDTLDHSLNSNVMAFPAQTAKAQDRYFQQDSALFERPAPAASPQPPRIVPVETAPVSATPIAAVQAKPANEKIQLGARLTITRVQSGTAAVGSTISDNLPEATAHMTAEPDNPAPQAEPPVAAVTVEPSVAAPPETTPEVMASEPTMPPKPRIVIIRRKPEEIAEVPMPAETQKPPSVETAA